MASASSELGALNPEGKEHYQMTRYHNDSLEHMVNYLSNLVLSWNEPAILNFVRAHIPERDIKRETEVEANKWEIHHQRRIDSYSYNVIFLSKLLCWFRSFFMWMRIPVCSMCKCEMALMENLQTSNTVCSSLEVFICNICYRKACLTRYTDPCVLLRTREGRCSEFATMFVAICLSLKLKTRYVYDFNDHCWVEVYNPIMRLWIHVDPAEGVVDKPLLYEIGWKKVINYIIAFGVTDVQDVTWRYSRNHKAIISRRSPENQEFLTNTIVLYRNRLLRNVRKRDEELKLVIEELAALMIPPVVDREEVFSPQDMNKYNTPAKAILNRKPSSKNAE